MENDSGMHSNLLQQLASSEATTRGKKTWRSVQEAYQRQGASQSNIPDFMLNRGNQASSISVASSHVKITTGRLNGNAVMSPNLMADIEPALPQTVAYCLERVLLLSYRQSMTLREMRDQVEKVPVIQVIVEGGEL